MSVLIGVLAGIFTCLLIKPIKSMIYRYRFNQGVKSLKKCQRPITKVVVDPKGHVIAEVNNKLNKFYELQKHE